MRFVSQYRFILLFFVLLIFCSVMVLRQFGLKQSRHVEMREAFILLYTRGYTNEARNLYDKLLADVPQFSKRISDSQLMDDFQRTLMLIDPDPRLQQTNNLIWSYHWTVSNELDRRAANVLQRALELAREEK